MKFCCGGFEKAYNNKGNKGFSVFSYESSLGVPYFYLFFWAIDPVEQETLTNALAQTDQAMSLSLASESPIQYCPWCGKNLARFYKKTWKEILHKPLTSFD